MFGLVQPDKVKVGQRIKEIKEGMQLSFTELGNRLGLKKPTISSYVQGYALAPEGVINQLSSISGKPVGWFYFGRVEDYIRDYLFLTGHEYLVKEHPEIVENILQEFYTGDFKNKGWENEVGYPAEAFIQDCFAEYADGIMKAYVLDITKEVLMQSTQWMALSEKEREDAVILISSEIIDYMDVSGDLAYGEKAKVVHMVEESINKLNVKQGIHFQEQYLVGKLINLLSTEEDTEQFISTLSRVFTDKHFSTQFGGEELMEIFQSMRPALMKLYRDTPSDVFYDWFEK
ncbi:helix-turn-helix domain-containing protein [Listeria monocytogenes]|uniref:helix-turn-helix domain-containing protein n=1 Tax=Listeria monocytogenes TaxID=1639 RepID=UPI001CB748C4|nr:helix-turn-helix transcriptional regulator [Listeria monocytogenes]